MTEQNRDEDRDRDATALEGAQVAAGIAPSTKSAEQIDEDSIPLSEGSVRDGGGYMGGDSPEDAVEDASETREPLDSRNHFGGDGAQYVDPAIEDDTTSSGQRPSPSGTLPGDDGYDPRSGAGANQEG
jgi:hypothetical protein